SPAIMRVANSWLILNEGGGPTDDKPDVVLETPPDPHRTSAFLNIRVADMRRCTTIGAARARTSSPSPKTTGARSGRTCATPMVTSSRSVSPPASSTSRDGAAQLGTGAEPGLVGAVRPVGAAHVGVVVREDAERALPRRHDPCVHHVARRLQQAALHCRALRGRHVLVGRERDLQTTGAVLDAHVAVPVPVVVRACEPFGRPVAHPVVH